jgi:hypothetical protein
MACRQLDLTMLGLGFWIMIVMTISLKTSINKSLGGLGQGSWIFGWLFINCSTVVS